MGVLDISHVSSANGATRKDGNGLRTKLATRRKPKVNANKAKTKIRECKLAAKTPITIAAMPKKSPNK